MILETNHRRSQVEGASKVNTEPASHMFKAVALGDGAVGKTSCIKRYTEDSFSEKYIMTIGTTFALKTVEAKTPDNRTVNARVVLWDLAGQPTYNELRRRYMAGASMAIIVYDVTRPQTFLNVGEWFYRFTTVCPNAVVTVVANKIDRNDRLVPREAGEMVRDWLDVEHFETSAKTGENITKMFNNLVSRSIEKQAQMGKLGSMVQDARKTGM
ncbi:MAG: GTP-binding protein [Candidatus Lokiarchaeota archaeon]|nr:GTP-binding protein [Candidatus Lokiarchaeota archaeon]